MKRIETDLLGMPLPAPEFLKKDGGRRKIGYAARPGTGPKRQFCRTCKHSEKVLHHGEHTLKCGRMAHAWTHGRDTDIKPNAPACSEWARRDFKAEKRGS